MLYGALQGVLAQSRQLRTAPLPHQQGLQAGVLPNNTQELQAIGQAALNQPPWQDHRHSHVLLLQVVPARAPQPGGSGRKLQGRSTRVPPPRLNMTSASNSTAAARQVPPLTADLADDLAKRAPIDLHAREETAAFPPPLEDPATCDKSARYTTPSLLASSSPIDLCSQPPTLPAALVRNLPVLRITQGTWMLVPDLARFTRPWALPSALVNALPVLHSAWSGSRGLTSSPAPAPPAQAQEQVITVLPILNILPAPVRPATTSLLLNLTKGWNMVLGLVSCVASARLARLSTHTGTLAFAQGSGKPADQIPAWPALDSPSVQVIFAPNLSSPLQHINHSCNPNCRLTANLLNNTFVLWLSHVSHG
jgi:hypothetical protein